MDIDEYIDIVDADGQFTGQIALKSDAHKNGWFHNTIHVWLYADDGRVLLSQRASTKTIFPLLWDVSAAGHIDAGESIINAAKRETAEELGLELADEELTPIGVFKHMNTYANGKIKDYEFHHAYIARLRIPANKLILQPGEVDNVKLVDRQNFLDLLSNSEHNNHFVKSNYDYYITVLNKVEQNCKKL